ncbi:uncharacterized protein [Euwallacea similis]|uniref:uncharacterized protein n=1 Tax=Euwallacea similis TaxID=1736056 RepID=UPI003450A769
MSLRGRKGKTSQNSEKEIHLTDISTKNCEFRELLHKREVLIGNLSYFERYILENKNTNEIFQLKVRLESVEEDFSQFKIVQERLEFLNENEKENRHETQSAYYSLIAEAQQLIDTIKKNQDSKNSQPGHSRPLKELGKLPDLGLPSFFGNYETWFSFKSIFESLVHDRTDLSETEKLLYLKLCCKDDALKIIDSFEITPGNYTVALNLLKKRYENKKAVVNYHVRNILFNLPSAIKDSATNVRKLIDTVQQHKAALEKLKLPVDKWDALLNPIILSKLDERTNHDWERKQCHTESPTVNQLLDFLTDKCFALESSRGFSRPQSHRPDKDRNENRGQERGNGSISSKNYSYSLTQRVGRECHICNENHFVYQCPRFTQLSVSEKYNEIRKHKLCSNCLRVGHRNQECKSSGCKKCAKKHNTALHYEKREVGEGVQNSKNDGNSAPPLLPIDKQIMNKGKYSESEQSTRLPNSQDQDDARPWVDYSLTLASASLERDQVLLSTANILIADEKGEWQRCNALLDSGSQSNLMSERLCRKLNLSFKRINMPLYGISQLVTEINRQTQAKIKSRFNSFEANLTFLVLPTLTENLPLFKFSRAALKIPGQINLADEYFNEPKNIDILLEVDIFYDLLGSGKIKLGEKLPVLQETSLGWVISGNLAGFGSRNQKTVCNLSTNISNKMLNDSLTKFWHVEEFEHSKFLSKEESYCEEYFTQTTTRDKDNSFIVKYPFKIDKSLKLGESKSIALSRLKNLEKKLEKNEELKKQYVDFMNEYETLGHMTRQGPIGNDDSMPNSSYFLPHRAVVKDSITTKCRVVFDASCKTSSGVSLNDTLMVGPVVQDELYAILLRLRLRKIVLSTDIKMMCRYIKIQDSERDYQKILWRANSRDPVSVYRLNTVTYGTSSAPFQATRCLVELARQNENTYPRTSEIMKHSFYMDDLLVSLNSEEEALNVYKDLNKIMEQANFKLRKWASNSGTVLRNILESNDNENSDSFTLPHNKQLKMLGISWDPELDTLKYAVNVRFDSTHATKRTILATISQIFDPLGLIGPALIKAKLIIQELWRLQLDWYQEVPHDLRQRWEEFATQLIYLNECKVARHVILGNAIRIALYGFSDSSEKAYGACIYVGSVDDLGNHGVRLLTAKSRVAPVKKLTLPRLELSAAHLLAKLMHAMKETLDIPISHVKYFTDSSIVLAWIKIEPSNLKTFVANRVAKITELSREEDWAHVPSKDNPADVISRGLSPRELLQCNLWSHGPNFLRGIEAEVKVESNNEIPLNQLPELKAAPSVENTCITHVSIDKPDFNIFNRFSNLFNLRRVLGESCLAYEEMHTLLTKIEACLNSRPLMPISNDANDYLPLIPAHFLIGDSLVNLPQPEVGDVTISRLSRYERLLQLQQQFWNRWSRDYLTNLQTRSRWKKPKDKSIAIGSLVLLAEDNLPPLRWSLARVVQLHEGKDKVVRVVTVRLPNGNTSKRTLSKVCPLPINDD